MEECSSQLNDPASGANRDRLRPVIRTKFLYDVFNMCLDCLFGDEEFFGDIPIAVSTSELAKDLHFARCKWIVAEVFSQVGRYLRRNPLLAGMDLANGIQQFTGRHTLQHVTAGSGFKRTLNFHITGKGGQHDDTSFRELRPYRDDCVDATHVGKLQVHKRHVGHALRVAPDRFTATGGIPDQVHVVLTLDDGGKTFVQQRVVVNDQNANSIGYLHVKLHDGTVTKNGYVCRS